jgi:hypothetical protein
MEKQKRRILGVFTSWQITVNFLSSMTWMHPFNKYLLVVFLWNKTRPKLKIGQI